MVLRTSGGASCSYPDHAGLHARSVPQIHKQHYSRPCSRSRFKHRNFVSVTCAGKSGDVPGTVQTSDRSKDAPETSTPENGGFPAAVPSQTPPRLFSNVNERTMKHEPGTVLGAAALVAGTTVGAGILALPATTLASGFVASSVALTGSWLYSIISALLMAEVAINTMCEVGRPSGISITSMAERTLGPVGARAAGVSYALLHEALLVAYVARAGEILGMELGIPHAAAAALFVTVLGLGCYATSPNMLDAINSVLVAAVVASFVALLAVAAGGVDLSVLGESHWEAVPSTLPVLALAFVMQNVVPVIASQLEGDIRKVRIAIIAGLTVPLLMFLAWDAAILGSLGDDLQLGGDPVQLLVAKSDVAGPMIQIFSLLAIATSFIGFVLGLSDFISDILGLPPGGRQPVPYALTLLPPLVLALSFPGVFFSALSVAGAYGVMFLFGVLPAAMAWSERYAGTTVSRVQVVPGGRLSLLVVGAIAGGVILNETAKYISAP